MNIFLSSSLTLATLPFIEFQARSFGSPTVGSEYFLLALLKAASKANPPRILHVLNAYMREGWREDLIFILENNLSAPKVATKLQDELPFSTSMIEVTNSFEISTQKVEFTQL